MSCLSKNHPFLEPVDLSQSQLSLQRCSAGTALKELSVLELTLVVAMNHLMQLDDQESFNFEMVYAGQF